MLAYIHTHMLSCTPAYIHAYMLTRTHCVFVAIHLKTYAYTQKNMEPVANNAVVEGDAPVARAPPAEQSQQGETIHVQQAGEIAEPAPKRAKRIQYTEAQKELARKCVVDENMGYKAILKEFPSWGFNEHGLRTMVENIKARGTADRRSGSGRKRTVRTEETIERVRAFRESNPEATAGDVARETGLAPTTAREVLKLDLSLKPLRKVTAQRIKGANKEKRLEMCKKWDEEIENGSLDLTKVFWTDEKIFRLGACAGSNWNLVIWVKNDLKKSELPNTLIQRDDGKYQGGVSVMVAMGLCRRGAGTLRFAPEGTKINSATYKEIVDNTYLPDCHEYYGVPPDCIFQQDGAPSHTANVAQKHCNANFPKFWSKEQWPANSPDLNPLDFFAWGHLQRQVDKKKPKCLATLKVAIRQSVNELPLDMIQRSVLGFARRVKLCIRAGGGTFKDKTLLNVAPYNIGAPDEVEDEAAALGDL